MFVYAVEFTKVNKGSIDIQKNLIGVQRKSEELKATMSPGTYADGKQPDVPETVYLLHYTGTSPIVANVTGKKGTCSTL